MGMTTFSGPVRSLAGFIDQGPGTVFNVPNNTDTLALTVREHAGKVIRTNDATLTITLPAIDATPDPVHSGPGANPNTQNNQGVTFTIFIETTASSVKIGTNGTDKYVGSLRVGVAGAAANTYVPGATNDFINLNGTTTGGIAGSIIRITALTANKYLVQGNVIASGAVATPFADS